MNERVSFPLHSFRENDAHSIAEPRTFTDGRIMIYGEL